MKLIVHPARDRWPQLLQRPYADNAAVMAAVTGILKTVREKGDAALYQYAAAFDGAQLSSLVASPEERAAAERNMPENLKRAIQNAKQNIETFHAAQKPAVTKVETAPGVWCWQKSTAIQKVGLYIPGGTAPLFSTVLMLAVPAQLAGCPEIVLCTPPDKSGAIHPAILYTAQLCGVTTIVKAGGAQAIAALAFGTESVPAVYKIFGPGNQYVTAAKQAVQLQGIAIDMPAGPSEVCVVADETAVPSFVASDLLAQAEHGKDSQVLLVSTSAAVVQQVLAEVARQVSALPRAAIALQALENSTAIVVSDKAEVIDLVNEYAAEHLILACVDADAVAEKITTAGSVFIGNWSPESAGDYASGPNHTLPTNAAARAYSGVSLDSFCKKITFQKASETGLRQLAKTVVTMAEAEGLQAHANAVTLRVEFAS